MLGKVQSQQYAEVLSQQYQKSPLLSCCYSTVLSGKKLAFPNNYVPYKTHII